MNNVAERVTYNENRFISASPSLMSVFSLARRVARHNVPVLISGETGTGKECVAKFIHLHTYPDRNAPYVGINCAAIPESMLEAMLFGHEKGAFTGAITSVAGKFEQANGGTLLLDEIGDMPLALQAKLLRVLQEQEVERLGGRKPIALNIRVIACTNKDLQQEINEGTFRQDLFYRLSVVPIFIPPLRERQQDIIPLAKRFIEKYHNLHHGNIALSEEARTTLLNHPWPGNVRELENVIQRGIILSNGKEIQARDLNISTQAMVENISTLTSPANNENQPNQSAIQQIKQYGRRAEYQYIIALLKRYKGNKSKTAAFLGITPRALRYRLASMRDEGIDIEHIS